MISFNKNTGGRREQLRQMLDYDYPNFSGEEHYLDFIEDLISLRQSKILLKQYNMVKAPPHRQFSFLECMYNKVIPGFVDQFANLYPQFECSIKDYQEHSFSKPVCGKN